MKQISKQRLKGDFVQLPNHLVRHRDLSWDAVGMLAFVLSNAAGWDISVEYLIRMRGGGRRTVQKNLQELEAAGYAKLVTSWTGSQATGKRWVFFNTCQNVDGVDGQAGPEHQEEDGGDDAPDDTESGIVGDPAPTVPEPVLSEADSRQYHLPTVPLTDGTTYRRYRFWTGRKPVSSYTKDNLFKK